MKRIKKLSKIPHINEVIATLTERLRYIESEGLNDPDRDDNLYSETTDLIQALDLFEGLKGEWGLDPMGGEVTDVYKKGLLSIAQDYSNTWGKPIIEWLHE